MKVMATGFPYIMNTVELLDIALISDIQEASEHTSPCPRVDADGTADDCICPPETIYYLGVLEELNAGIRGGQVTPAFTNIGDLEKFCQRHEIRFKQAAKDEVVPNAEGWDRCEHCKGEMGTHTVLCPIAVREIGFPSIL